jgi:hypothetical protein
MESHLNDAANHHFCLVIHWQLKSAHVYRLLQTSYLLDQQTSFHTNKRAIKTSKNGRFQIEK